MLSFYHHHDKMNKSIGVILIAFCSIGIISNVLSLSICFRKRLRKCPLFVLMGTKSLTEVPLLFSIALVTYIVWFSKFDISFYHLEICQFAFLFVFWGIHSSRYLLVIIIYIRETFKYVCNEKKFVS